MENNEPSNSPGRPKFMLGTVIATRMVGATLLDREGARDWITECIRRHATGDWGDVDPHDAALNTASASDEIIADGARVVSVYPVPENLKGDGDPDDRIWIITNTEAWDAVTPMRVTTILWPSDY